VPDGLVIDARTIEDMPPDKVVLVCTGSQGEPMAALSRMANRDHQIRIVEDDTVVLASSLIPGNETAIYRVINGLTRWGAKVVHKGNAKVHVSGHASAGELLYFYNLAKPRNVMPVHGEWRHLRANGDLAILTGVPSERIVLAEDGIAKISGKVPCGYVYVDGLSVGDITEASLKDRRILGEEGFISVFLVVNTDTGKIVGGPEIHSRGAGIDDASLAAVTPLLEEALARAASDGVADQRQLQQLCRRIVGKWVSDTFRRRPMILPVVVEV
jgi:ribonuclease J